MVVGVGILYAVLVFCLGASFGTGADLETGLDLQISLRLGTVWEVGVGIQICLGTVWEAGVGIVMLVYILSGNVYVVLVYILHGGGGLCWGEGREGGGGGIVFGCLLSAMGVVARVGWGVLMF